MYIEYYFLFNLVLIIFVFVLWTYCKLSVGICKCKNHLVGKVAVITGGCTGIGFETAKDLAERGARVIITDIDDKRGINAKNEIIAATKNSDIHYNHLDLASFKSVKKFAAEIITQEKRLDILINNAGVFGSENVKTEDGLLLGMQVNYFGPFLLTNLLLPLLKSSKPSRIINVSSMISYFGTIDLQNLNMEKETPETYKREKVYANSKLCLILITHELGRMLKGTGVTANCLHPGVSLTEMSGNTNIALIAYSLPWLKLFWKTKWEAAQTSVYLAVSPEVADVTGKYFRDCRESSALSRQAKDTEHELGRRLKGTGVTANCLHPGVSLTEMSGNTKIALIAYSLPWLKLFWKTKWEAAQTSVYLAVSPEVSDVTGKYFRDCRESSALSRQAKDTDLAQKLWVLTVKLVGL
ncbi:Retinol dehydrogenase 13 [Papilio machaon]|uniref:Retinol dehydrogenase 13 n=1 Tax=Papilio machaon TaxID=76193 RepID=A0A0N1IDL3_PAPMA|nr:Retinol dehydrogenase 13 [Papilio machaon]